MTARKKTGFFILKVVVVQGRMFFQNDSGRIFPAFDSTLLSRHRASPGKFQVREGKKVICRGVISVDCNIPLEITHGTLPDGTQGKQKYLSPGQCRGLELRIFPSEQGRPDLMKKVPDQREHPSMRFMTF